MTHVYTNAAKIVEIEDYPMGGSKRGRAIFKVTTGTKGQGKGKQRVERVTTCNGKTAKPKTMTYGGKAVILTGDDGRTYPATWSEFSDMITIMQSNMMYQHEVIHRSEEPDRYDQITQMMEETERNL